MSGERADMDVGVLSKGLPPTRPGSPNGVSPRVSAVDFE
jgi:hypothetical protein